MENSEISRLENLISKIDSRLKDLEGVILKDSNKKQTEDLSANLRIPPPKVEIARVAPPQAVSAPQGGTSYPAGRHWEPLTPQAVSAPQGGTWLAAMGVLFFILAASFFIKLAIEAGWLTPMRQLSGAVLFGLFLVVAGYQLRVRDYSYATFLPAAGVVILFMSVFGGHLYWDLYSFKYAIVAVGAVSFFSLFLFKQFKHDFFLISSAVGSYSVPLLLAPGSLSPFDLCFYFIFWDILYSTISIMLGKRLMIGLTAYLSLVVWQIDFESYSLRKDFWIDAALFQAAQFSILALATIYFSARKRINLTIAEAWALFPALLVFYVIEYTLISKLYPDLAPWLSLFFGALIFVVYGATKRMLRKDSLASEPAIITFVAITIFHGLYLEILSDIGALWFGLILIPATALLHRTRLSFDKIWPVYCLAIGVFFSEYFKLIDGPIAKDSSTLVLNFLYFSFLFAGYYLRKERGGIGTWMLLLAVVQILIGLQRIAESVAASPENLYITSGTWAIFGVGMLLLATRWHDTVLAKTSMAILGLVAAKVLILDIGSAGSLARVLALLVIGALLYFAGLYWRTVGSWEKKEE